MKNFNNTAVNVGQNIVAIDALVQTSASQAYIVHTHATEALPIGVQSASYQGQDAAFIRVAVDDTELENYAVSAGNVVEVIELPDTAAARAKFLAQWARKIAQKNKAGFLPLLLLPLAACGGGGLDAPSPTFVVTQSDGDVSFGGTATGDITVDVSGADASFVRGSLTAATTVTNLFASGSPKELVVASGQTVIATSDASFAVFAATTGAPNIVSNSARDRTTDLIEPSASPVTASASAPSAPDGSIVRVPEPM